MKSKIIKFSPYEAKIINNQHFDITQISKNSERPDDFFNLAIEEINLDSYHFDDDCELSVQVKKGRSDIQGESIGTIANTMEPEKLFNFSETRGLISCRLTVTQKGKFHYCGYSEWRHPNSSVYKSILPVQIEKIGEVLWLLELPNDAGTEFPKFIMNEGLAEKVNKNTALQGTFIPSAIYSVLMRMYEQEFEGIEEQSSWHYKWFDFATNFNQETETIDSQTSQADAESWAREVTSRFSKDKKYKQLFIKNFMSE